MKSMRANHFVNKDGPTIQSDPHAVYLTGSNAVATVPSSCSDTITPSCLRALYKTSDYVPRATKKNKLGVAGYLNEFASRADLQVRSPTDSRTEYVKADSLAIVPYFQKTFFKSFRPDAVNSSYSTVLVNNGGDDQTQPGVEVRRLWKGPVA